MTTSHYSKKERSFQLATKKKKRFLFAMLNQHQNKTRVECYTASKAVCCILTKSGYEKLVSASCQLQSSPLPGIWLIELIGNKIIPCKLIFASCPAANFWPLQKACMLFSGRQTNSPKLDITINIWPNDQRINEGITWIKQLRLPDALHY